MKDLRAVTTTGEDTMLEEAAIEEFKVGLRGELLRPGDGGYEDARKIWNAMIDKRPALIARCAGVADVIHSVNFARTNTLLVAIRGGGHNVAGNATCDGGLVIDLSQMKGIRVDPIERTARAEGGVTWGELDRETQAFGLATTGGIVSTTGIAGLTLGGGLGWLSRKYGLACDNLLSADTVTADGRFLTASASENEDLFWGLRGGGGNFGVVTSLEYRLRAVGPTVLAGWVVHPPEKAKEVLEFYREFTSTEPDELASYVGLVPSPEGDPVVEIVVCYNGSIEEGERVLQPLREFGPPLVDQIGPMPYTQFQTILDDLDPPGLQQYWKSNFLERLSDDAFDTMVDFFANRPSPLCQVIIEELGGAVSRLGSEETAFTHRDTRYSLLIIGMSPDPAESDKITRWAREFWQAMQPFSSAGVYVNYLGQEADEGADRVRAAYGPEKYERLVALKNKYDPTNLFRVNQNIRPTV